jgi:hypothetical protein
VIPTETAALVQHLEEHSDGPGIPARTARIGTSATYTTVAPTFIVNSIILCITSRHQLLVNVAGDNHAVHFGALAREVLTLAP